MAFDPVMWANVERIVELVGDPFKSAVWFDLEGVPITKAEVQLAIATGTLGADPFKPSWAGVTEWSRTRHAQRVAYLAVHGWPDPIEVDVGSDALYIAPTMEDGYHRLAAAIFLGRTTICASLIGETSRIDELIQTNNRN